MANLTSKKIVTLTLITVPIEAGDEISYSYSATQKNPIGRYILPLPLPYYKSLKETKPLKTK